MIAALTRDAPADSLPVMVGMPMFWACRPRSHTSAPSLEACSPTFIKNGKVVGK